MSSGYNTLHWTQIDVVNEYYITLQTEWRRHWALHLNAHSMSSLNITSLRTKWCRHLALRQIAHWMKLLLALLISHAHKTISSLIITSDIIPEYHIRYGQKTMSSLIITSQCTRNNVVVEYCCHAQRRRHRALRTSQYKQLPLSTMHTKHHNAHRHDVNEKFITILKEWRHRVWPHSVHKMMSMNIIPEFTQHDIVTEHYIRR